MNDRPIYVSLSTYPTWWDRYVVLRFTVVGVVLGVLLGLTVGYLIWGA